MAGAVLSALNFSLDETMLATILHQLEAKFIFVDHQFVDVVLKALDSLSQLISTTSTNIKRPILVLIPDHIDQESSSSHSSNNNHHNHDHYQNLPPGTLNYNHLLELAAENGTSSKFEIIRPNDERDPISVNYTSGSTGKPKGVVYSHRAVYLNSLANIINMDMTSTRQTTVFLWTVDMFRCNGWCYTWAIAAIGGTNVCLRNVSADIIFDAIALHKVTHLCGKPPILNILAEAADNGQKPLSSRVDVVVAGSLPSVQVLRKVAQLGFNISHGYGMTEALGPAIIEPWKPDDHDIKCCRLGRNLITMEGFDVKDSNTMESVANDGKTMGEIMFRGNTLMSGYLKNPKASEEAFRWGWYRTGDVGIRHPDGYIQMKDRAVDVVNCGGQAVSTLEVEAVLLSHPRVLEAAVVGRRLDDCSAHNDQTLCAFVKLKESSISSSSTTSQEIIEFCGENLPAYMVPKAVIFGDLPINPTGKVQKFVLRDRANGLPKSLLD